MLAGFHNYNSTKNWFSNLGYDFHNNKEMNNLTKFPIVNTTVGAARCVVSICMIAIETFALIARSLVIIVKSSIGKNVTKSDIHFMGEHAASLCYNIGMLFYSIFESIPILGNIPKWIKSCHAHYVESSIVIK